MFGMKRRAAERKERERALWQAEWDCVNYDLPVKTYYLDGDAILASGYDLDDGDITFWTGKKMGLPGRYSAFGVMPGFSTLRKTLVLVKARGTWKELVEESA